MRSIDEPVNLTTYDPSWPSRYRKEAARLRDGIGAVALGIEHIGSTAVPGLVAKPVVDIMVGVADQDATEAVVSRLVSLGYEDCGGGAGRRYLRTRDGEHFNVQIMDFQGNLWRANLDLRDCLRSHPDGARRYAEAKRAAAEQEPMLLAYSRIKSEIIEELMDEASK